MKTINLIGVMLVLTLFTSCGGGVAGSGANSIGSSNSENNVVPGTAVSEPIDGIESPVAPVTSSDNTATDSVPRLSNPTGAGMPHPTSEEKPPPQVGKSASYVDGFEPDNSLGQAKNLNFSGSEQWQGRGLDPAGDRDWCWFNVTAGAQYVMRTSGTTDTFGTLYNNYGGYITSDDDSDESWNFNISWTATYTGVAYLEVRHYSAYGTGNYSLGYRSQTSGGGGQIPVAQAYDFPEGLAGAAIAQNGWQANRINLTNGVYDFNPFMSTYQYHWAADLNYPNDNINKIPVYAVAAGVVKEVDDTDQPNEWGKCILIEHLNPGGATTYSFYAHLWRIDVVRGQIIPNGQRFQIGIVGNANGVYGDGWHLHWEMRFANAANWKGNYPLGYRNPGQLPEPLRQTDPIHFVLANRNVASNGGLNVFYDNFDSEYWWGAVGTERKWSGTRIDTRGLYANSFWRTDFSDGSSPSGSSQPPCMSTGVYGLYEYDSISTHSIFIPALVASNSRLELNWMENVMLGPGAYYYVDVSYNDGASWENVYTGWGLSGYWRPQSRVLDINRAKGNYLRVRYQFTNSNLVYGYAGVKFDSFRLGIK